VIYTARMSLSDDKTPQKLQIRLARSLGPGVITGAADDDPSGIATYSIAGAQLGTSLLWTAFLTWPLMAAVQMMCARIGMATGLGLAGALEKKYSRPVVLIAAGALLLANTMNIGADLAGMSDALEVLSGVPSELFVAPLGMGISYATIVLRFEQIERFLKWLVCTLFVYVITAFLVDIDWPAALFDTFVPSIPSSSMGWATLVAILGTTISPYLFFWQASEEVEDERLLERNGTQHSAGLNRQRIFDRSLDVGVGTFFSNVVMYFIILTTAATLHRAGIFDIQSSKDAALALRPLAGDLASTLFAAGIIGVGCLAIPTLAGSAAYALADVFRWKQGLDEKFDAAPRFYTVMVVAIGVGMLLSLLRINPIQALFWTAVINGLVAPFLLVGIVSIARDSAIMRGYPSSRLSIIVVAFAAVMMFVAGIGMFVL
jgi:NRAMP (natural resistance-associated macrophage protein)-like metal ion transporter